MNKLSDEWRTPDDLFNILDKGGVYQGIKFDGFNFDIDLCATKENSKCIYWFKDYLNTPKSELTKYCRNEGGQYFRTAFMNPPYSNPKPFIEKAWEDSKHCKIVCLVKCDPSTRWWATFWNYDIECDNCLSFPEDYTDRHTVFPFHVCNKCKGTGRYNGHKPGAQVLYFPKRIKFDPPIQEISNSRIFKLAEKPNKWFSMCKCYRENDCVIQPNCKKCKGLGYIELSGPTFPSALIIMDRRN